MSRSPEHGGRGETKLGPSEHSVELPRRLERERSTEHDSTGSETYRARAEALKEASSKEQYRHRETSEKQPAEPFTGHKRKLNDSFKKTMHRVQSDMSPAEKTFSKIIHSPTVEKVSDAVGSTIARPNAILSGSVGALIVTGGLYFTARYFGFSLSGSETILAFVIGWSIGLVFDLGRGIFKSRL